MKVKDIKRLIEGLDDNEEIYVGYDDMDESDCAFLTAEDIIESANNHAGVDDFEEDVAFTNVDDALCYLMEMDYTYHYMW